MAIIKLASPISGIRGTVGGLTYSANKSGPYVRPWYRSANPRTNPQTTARTYLTRVGAAWNDLSTADRTAWNTFAAAAAQEKTNSLGDPYYLSGWQWYVANACWRQQAGYDPLNAAPSTNSLAAPSLDSVTIQPTASGNSTFVLHTDQFTGASAAFFYARPILTTTQAYFPNRTWLIYTVAAPPTGSQDITSNLVGAFGDPTPNQLWYCALGRFWRHGRMSALTTMIVPTT